MFSCDFCIRFFFGVVLYVSAIEWHCVGGGCGGRLFCSRFVYTVFGSVSTTAHRTRILRSLANSFASHLHSAFDHDKRTETRLRYVIYQRDIEGGKDRD